MLHPLRLIAVVLLTTCSLLASTMLAQNSPKAAADELFAADRAFSTASARAADVIAGLSPMFADDVLMPVPGNRFARGRAEAVEALRTNPDNATSHAEWTPIGGGISADGRHGFTYGYFTVRKADSTEQPGKYLAYWIKGTDGWRVAVYRRRPRPAGPPPASPMRIVLPASLVHATSNAIALEAARGSLEQAERSFSLEAQSIGLTAAFAKYGSADSINMGGPETAGFLYGADAISREVGAGTPSNSSPLSWGPDQVIVASSGDLGVTIGMIRANAPAPDGTPRPPVPFFTIWRRPTPSSPWRYIAE